LDLETLDGPTAIEMMESGDLTSVELTQAYIDRIYALNQAGPALNAVSQLNKEALKEAKKTDELRAEGKILSPAMGLPILLKDLIDVKGMYTSAGNWSLRDSFPETDSGVAKKLREHGVVILGKLGLSEYANSFGNQPSGFSNLTGQVLHATDADLNPSGSSSGTGAAGAAAMSMLTIGTETSGSITSPSRAEGLVGLRPTVGLVPGYGVAPIRASQDTAGPMDRTVANAALTLTAIAGSDPIDEAYYERYYEEGGLDVKDIVPEIPNPLPDYLDALDPNYVKGMRIGYFGNTAEVNEAKQALEAAGAILVERPLIETDPMPSLSGAGEQHMDIDFYYERLGPNAPINSLQEEIEDNEANSHEALKFGNGSHTGAAAVAYGPGTPWEAEFKTNLPIRKEKAWQGIERMLNNNTPGDPSDDFTAILGTSNTGPAPNGPLAGWPAITVPLGYAATTRRPVGVSFSGTAYSEKDLLGIAYVLEQQTKKSKPASLVNPSMYRCAETVPAPAFAERGDCNPKLEETLALAGGKVPELPFALELESAQGLQDRMTAGTLTATDLTKAYLARIAVANAAGPALQAVRAVNPKAVAEAEALDAERAKSGARGPLHGIPVILDDGIDAAGLPSTGGSIALQGATPDESSRIVAKLKAAGAIVLGKANVSELNGLFSSTMPEGYSSLGGQILLASDTDKTVAGSGAGSAAATASGMAAMAVGMETSTDTAQMIAPAAAAGVVALKPTVGRVSRAGVMPIAKSQDSPGPIAKTVYDAAVQLQTIAGVDFKDTATTGTPAVGDYLTGLTGTALTGKKVAVITGGSAPYPEAVTKLGELGATTVTKTIGAAAPNPIVTRE
ncbi:MAG TPA: amidase family protein, partial [Solirubrobacterales bacterium]|nr:amidase family protein [Solirubrobacterales bacterium]